MTTNTVLYNFGVLLDPSLQCDAETGKPDKLYVDKKGRRIFPAPPPNITVRDELCFIQHFFMNLVREFRKFTTIHPIVFSAKRELPEALTPQLLKVRRILTWGHVSRKDYLPMLELFQDPIDTISQKIAEQNLRWSQLNSKISLEKFNMIMRNLGETVHPHVYVGYSFQDPTIDTFIELYKIMKEMGVYEKGRFILNIVASRVFFREESIESTNEILKSSGRGDGNSLGFSLMAKLMFCQEIIGERGKCEFNGIIDYDLQVLYTVARRFDPNFDTYYDEFSPKFSPTRKPLEAFDSVSKYFAVTRFFYSSTRTPFDNSCLDKMSVALTGVAQFKAQESRKLEQVTHFLDLLYEKNQIERNQ